jgi:hypothetical protein
MKLVARLSTAVVLAGLISAAPASAQNIAYSGNTLGCFYTTGMSCTPVVNAILGNLSFSGNTFSGTTQSGFGAIGNLASSDNNLGVFSLPGTNDPRNFDTEPANFMLYVKWITPGGAIPSELPYTAMLNGVLGATTGGVTVQFTALPKNFIFDGGTGALRLNIVSLNNTGTGTLVPVTGDFRVSATVVPEPSTYVLLASGLAGLVMFGKRRQKNA